MMAKHVCKAAVLSVQCIAYAIYITPVFFMWEKLIGTHYKPNWIRLPSRLPVGEPLTVCCYETCYMRSLNLSQYQCWYCMQ